MQNLNKTSQSVTDLLSNSLVQDIVDSPPMSKAKTGFAGLQA